MCVKGTMNHIVQPNICLHLYLTNVYSVFYKVGLESSCIRRCSRTDGDSRGRDDRRNFSAQSFWPSKLVQWLLSGYERTDKTPMFAALKARWKETLEDYQKTTMTTKDGLNRIQNITEPIGVTSANFRSSVERWIN